MICSNCKRKTTTLRSIIRRGKIMNGCELCLGEPLTNGQNDFAKYQRDRDREDHRQDIVQRFEPHDYLHARGIDAAREAGYSDEDIRKHY